MIEKLSLIINEFISIDFWISIFSTYRGLGPVIPVLFAMIESFIPALPLIVIVTFNIGAYGALLGFIYSWIGSTLGSILVFLFFRNIIKKSLLHWVLERKTIAKGLAWVNRSNQTVLFLIAIFPFTPSSLLNICFGLSDFNSKVYMITISCAKLFMIFFLTLFGNSFFAAFENPAYFILCVIIILLLAWLSRYFSKKSGL
ncbi:MAG: VTT domain-containing protein [Eubacteriales bacterium]